MRLDYFDSESFNRRRAKFVAAWASKCDDVQAKSNRALRDRPSDSAEPDDAKGAAVNARGNAEPLLIPLPVMRRMRVRFACSSS